jgi:hypothetical protein
MGSSNPGNKYFQDLYSYGDYWANMIKSEISGRDTEGRRMPPHRLPFNPLNPPISQPYVVMNHVLRDGVDTTGVPRSYGLSEEGATRLRPVFTPLHCNAFPLPLYNHGGH